MRSKEDAQDYRYFPDPDLVPIRISDEWIEAVKERQPELQDAKAERYKKEFDIPEYDIGIITGSKKLADIFEETTAICHNPKKGIQLAYGGDHASLKRKGDGAGRHYIYAGKSGSVDPADRRKCD